MLHMKSVSKRRAWLCAVLAAAALGSAGWGAASVDRGREAQTVYAQAQEETYLVKTVDGYICIFVSENLKTPAEKTGIDSATLRLEDQASLERGIRVASRQELLMLLEDLGS